MAASLMLMRTESVRNQIAIWAGPSGRAVWGIGLDHLDADTVDTNLA
jgi:hypothetical protein